MKTLSLEFDTTDLKLSPESPDKKLPTAAELSKRVLLLAVNQYSNQCRGLSKPERVLYYEIDKLLEPIGKDNLNIAEIEFSDEAFGFIRKVFRETRLPADRAVGLVEKNIDAVKMD